MDNSKKIATIAIVLSSLLVIVCSLPIIRYKVNRIINAPESYTRRYINNPLRGEIFDCNSNILATNKTLYNIHMDYSVVSSWEWEEDSRQLSIELSHILPHKTAPQWWQYLQKAKEDGNKYIPIAKNISKGMADSLSKLTIFNRGRFFGGFICGSQNAREYPFGNLARRTIGVVSLGIGNGIFGIEGEYEHKLKGEIGKKEVQYKHWLGKLVRREISNIEKRDGYDIHTTLDMNYQSIADSVLRKAVKEQTDIAGGCIAIMDVKTGELKAIANIHKTHNGTVGEYFNYSLVYGYEPGAIAHTMTLSAALSDGIIKSLNEKTGKNGLSVLEGFKSSSNNTAANLALKYSQTPDFFYKWIDIFCFDESKFDISGMRISGITETSKMPVNNTTSLAAIGEGFEYFVTPMHMLTFYNTIANGGKMMRPMLIKKISHSNADIKTYSPEELHPQVLSTSVADTVKKALSFCISENIGTGKTENSYKIIGKSSTVRDIIYVGSENRNKYIDQLGRRKYASTFAGFYPSANPQYTIVCALFSFPIKTMPLHANLPQSIAKEVAKATLKND